MNSQNNVNHGCNLQKTMAARQPVHRFSELMRYASGLDASSLAEQSSTANFVRRKQRKAIRKKVGLSHRRPT
jgi:hypothetical protein